MKVKKLKNVGFKYDKDDPYSNIIEMFKYEFVMVGRVGLTKREFLALIKWGISIMDLTSKERLDLHQCIMNEQYTQKRSKT